MTSNLDNNQLLKAYTSATSIPTQTDRTVNAKSPGQTLLDHLDKNGIEVSRLTGAKAEIKSVWGDENQIESELGKDGSRTVKASWVIGYKTDDNKTDNTKCEQNIRFKFLEDNVDPSKIRMAAKIYVMNCKNALGIRNDPLNYLNSKVSGEMDQIKSLMDNTKSPALSQVSREFKQAVDTFDKKLTEVAIRTLPKAPDNQTVETPKPPVQEMSAEALSPPPPSVATEAPQEQQQMYQPPPLQQIYPPPPLPFQHRITPQNNQFLNIPRAQSAILKPDAPTLNLHLRGYMNVAAKGSDVGPPPMANGSERAPTLPHGRDLHDIYDGQSSTNSVNRRRDDSLSLLQRATSGELRKPNGDYFSTREIADLERLNKNRQIVAIYNEHLRDLQILMVSNAPREQIENQAKRIGSLIVNNFDALAQSNSPNVVHHENGSTSFCFPGGCEGHAMSYEIKRDGATGGYQFIIHNRGDGSGDARIHGNLVFQSGGVQYGKTSVAINIPDPNLLRNPDFFGELMKATVEEDSMNKVYNIVDKHLLQRGCYTAPKTPEEIEFEQLYSKKDNTEAERSRMRVLGEHLKTQGYHSYQKFGTCTESNFTAAEKAMVSADTLRITKLYTISNLTAQVGRDRYQAKTEEERQDAEAVLAHAQQRQAALRNKIGTK